MLLAVSLVIVASANSSHAGFTNRPPPPPGQTTDNSKNVIWFVVGGIVIAVVAGLIGGLFADPPPPPPPSSPPPPPPNPPVAQLPTNPAPQAQSVSRVALRPTCNLPPVGETRFTNRLVLDIPASVSDAQLNAIAQRHDMTRLETFTMRLTGRRLHLWNIDGNTSVEDMIRNVCAERLVAGLQPEYRFFFAQDPAGQQSVPVNSDQYAPAKLNLSEAHRLARGNRVIVAVIDSEVDAGHPDIAGTVLESFESSADDEQPHSHGTGMAGAIVAHKTMLGTAPNVRLLTVRAFSTRANNVEGTTFNILKGLDWAAEKGARVVNMSFAGPKDPRLLDALDKAYKKGMVLIAAAGNAGPKSPPMYPGADKNVIAVTATDANDAVFTGANRGDYIAVAAPGVDILAPAPDGTYQFTTGTSVATAEVSGVVALLLERNPALTPADVRRILMSTAKDLGPKGKDRDFGAGLVDALKAVNAAKAR
jgi:hypothetical protein